MNRYITRGIANNLPNILQHQLWQLVSEREQEQTKDNTSVDYFHIFQFNKHRNQLYIKHKNDLNMRKSIKLIIQKQSISIRSTLFEKMM